jgi:superfamily II DNA or RNA helicase
VQAVYPGALRIHTDHLPKVQKRLTIDNPAHITAKRFGRTWQARNEPEQLYGIRSGGEEEHVWLMRGVLDLVKDMPPYEDPSTPFPRNPDWPRFLGDLRPHQTEANMASDGLRMGIFAMPTGSGKTVTAVALAATLQIPTLVIVPTKDIFDQWVETCRTMLGIEPGIYGSGKKEPDFQYVTIAMMQTLQRMKDQRYIEFASNFGCCIVDEMHRSASPTLQRLMWLTPAWYRFGFTATDKRSDGKTKMLNWAFGKRVYSITSKELADMGYLRMPTVIPVFTDFEYPMAYDLTLARAEDSVLAKWPKKLTCFTDDADTIAAVALGAVQYLMDKNGMVVITCASKKIGEQMKKATAGNVVADLHINTKAFTDCQTAMCEDEERQQIAIDTAVEEATAGNTVLVLGGRIEHCEQLADKITAAGIRCEAVHSKVKKKERKALLQEMRDGTLLVGTATSLADEGLDIPRLGRLVKAFPMRAEPKTIQRAGRCMRDFPGHGDPIIYDMIDHLIEAFENQWFSRKRSYRKEQFEIQSIQNPD